MKTILFQGDSITDAGRSRENPVVLGTGYPLLVKASLGFENPGEYTFLNKGVSGNRSVDVYARIKADIINLKPDIMSILIGVNDVWHEVSYKNGVDTEKYEKICCMMLDEIFSALPDIKIMILEPFVLKGTATENTDDIPDKWDQFYYGVREKAAAARRIAEKYGLPFVELQNKFDEAAKLAENSYWLSDGVHPTSMGHELIKREWIKCFEKMR